MMLPTAVHDPLAMLAAAAVPLALLTLGASLCRPDEPLSAGRAEIMTITALKLIAQPAIAFGAGVALGLSRDQMLAVVVCAGLPTAQNVFVFARQYDAWVEQASSAVLVGTLLSVVTLTGTMWLVKTGHLPGLMLH